MLPRVIGPICFKSMITHYCLMMNKGDSIQEFEIRNYSMICFHLQSCMILQVQIKVNSVLLKNNLLSIQIKLGCEKTCIHIHTIKDLEEFDSLHKWLGMKSLWIRLVPEYVLIIFGLPIQNDINIMRFLTDCLFQKKLEIHIKLNISNIG